MKTKRTLLIVVVSLMISNHSFSQNYTPENAKKALRTIWLSYIINGSQGCLYIEPSDYINEKNTTNITGQNFISYSMETSTKYEKIELTILNNAITGAKLNTRDVKLNWENNRITKIKIESTDGEYSINYNTNNELNVLKLNALKNKKEISYSLEFQDEKLKKVIKYYDKPGEKKPWIHYVTDYTYNQNDVTITNNSYKFDKSNKPENIVSNSKTVYRMINEHTYAKDELNFNNEYSYDENNILIGRKFRIYGNLEDYTFEYNNGVLFRQIKTITKAGAFLEKVITIHFSLTNLPDSTPNYEKTKGMYKFDVNNDLIFEKSEGKYREKINGVWSEWKNTVY